MKSLKKVNHMLGNCVEAVNAETTTEKDIDEMANMTVREGALYYLGLGELLLDKSDEDPDFGNSNFIDTMEKLMSGEITLEDEPE